MWKKTFVNMIISMLVSAVVSVCIILGSLFLPGFTDEGENAILQESDRQERYSVGYLSAAKNNPQSEYSLRAPEGLTREEISPLPGGAQEGNIHARLSVVF